MAKIEPFCGFRYNTEKIPDLASVTAPSNDHISEEFYSQQCDKSEYNILKIGFSENHKLLNEWLSSNILIQDKKPAIYIYEQKFIMKNNLQSLKGIISLVNLEDYENKVVLPHQKTSLGGCKNQFNLMYSTEANINPIFSLYNDTDISISSIIVANSTRKPDISFVTDEKITQNIWIIDDPDVIAQLKERFEDKKLFITDGHHRYEAALKYRDKMRAENPDDKNPSYEYTMMALMPMYSSGLFSLPTHRLVKGKDNIDENILIGMLTEDFKVSKIYFTDDEYDTVILNRISDVIYEKYFGLYTGNDYYYLLKPYNVCEKATEPLDKSAVLNTLEATLLNTSILEKYFELSKEELENPEFVTYTRSAKEAILEVQKGNFMYAFFLNSTKVDEMRRVAEAGEVMPLKSTFFWPKMMTGLVIYKF